MPQITIEDRTKTIWEQNPWLSIIEFFKTFKDDLGEDLSSKILTAIFLVYHPNSDLREDVRGTNELEEDVATNYLKDPKFDWRKYDGIKEEFLKQTTTKVQQHFIRYENEVEKLLKFVETGKYTEKNALSRASLLEKSDKIWNKYLELKQKVEQEKADSTKSLGNYSKSMAEKFANVS